MAIIDYDLNAGAVSGLMSGKGKGKIAGSPEGLAKSDDTSNNWRFTTGSVDRAGVIKGSPIGIMGKVRSAGGTGRMAAISRKLGG